MDEQYLFPALPEDLASLTDEQLTEALDAALAAKDKVVAQDAEFLGELSAAEILEQMKSGVSGIPRLKAEQAARVEAETNLATELAALNAQVDPDATLEADDGDAGDGDDSGDGDDAGDADGESDGDGEEGDGEDDVRHGCGPGFVFPSSRLT